MNSSISDLPHYLRVYQGFLGRRIYLVFALAMLAALAEGVGLLMLLPLLQTLGDTDTQALSSPSLPTGGIGEFINGTLASMGLAESSVAILLIITVAFLIKGLFIFGSYGYRAYLVSQLLRELKGRMFDYYSSMQFSYYAKRDTGHFTNVINGQIDLMMAAFQQLIQVGARLVNTFVYLGLAFVVAWRFGLMALVIGFLFLFLFRRLNDYVRTLSRKTSLENGHLAQLMIQSLHAFKFLTATGQMGHLRKGVILSITKLTDYKMRVGIADAFTNALREPVIVAFIMIIVLVQIVFMQEPLAPIMVSIILFNRGLNSTMGVQANLQTMYNSIGGLEMVRDEFIEQRKYQEAGGDKVISSLSQSISLQNVWFSYDPKHEYVLQDISMEIPVRTSIALVGESGAGKSTLIDMVTLMLKPQQGSILIDGVESDQINLGSWREQIGYVSQDTVTFNDSIANNICLWEGDIEQDEQLFDRVRAAANQAHIANFIETLSEGYNTPVGDRGVRLSGGQKQRLFIARELFRQPNLLILDEATSALDSESERAIQKSIDDLKGKTTVIIIAHRLSTIRNVDYVYVFDKGHLVEEGGYEQLRNAEGSRFGRMVSMQRL